jgi:hypothetical protein
MGFKKISFIFIIFGIFGLINFSHANSLPGLNFSDIVDGPNTGLGDGLGSGSIVTVWGNNLGATQGSSHVYFTDSTSVRRDAAYVYYWKNADGSLPSGPADLYAYQKMQEIAFSLPDGAAGQGTITIETDGGTSNSLPFTVRTGNIYWVGDTPGGIDPNNSNNGSYGAPWATVSYPSGAESKIAAGSIIYLFDHTTEGSFYVRTHSGSAGNENALISYPGHTSGTIVANECIRTNGVQYCGFRTYLNPQYWVQSKLSFIAISNGIITTPHGRIIGNEVTDGSVAGNTPYIDCAEGAGGAISSSRGNQAAAKIYGNYIHDFGCQATSNQQHTTYFTNRLANGATGDVAPLDFEWNYLRDNQARFGIHFYDEHGCYGYTDTTKVAHNVVVNQVSPGFNVGGWICNVGYAIPGDFDVFDNLFVNNGLLGDNGTDPQAIQVQGAQVTGRYRFYNNTIVTPGYDGASSNSNESAAITIPGPTYGTVARRFSGTWEWVNNIVVQGHNLGYVGINTGAPTVHSNNLWYDSDGVFSPPTWDTLPINENPELGGDYALQSISPAIDTGYDAGAILVSDILGISRPQGAAYDIGAFEFEYVGQGNPNDHTAPAAPNGIGVD